MLDHLGAVSPTSHTVFFEVVLWANDALWALSATCHVLVIPALVVKYVPVCVCVCCLVLLTVYGIGVVICTDTLLLEGPLIGLF